VSDDFEFITGELAEVESVSVPALSVVVDFNDLLERFDEADTFRLITNLKDLLS
jgi:hypothetical protein